MILPVRTASTDSLVKLKDPPKGSQVILPSFIAPAATLVPAG